MTVTAPRTAPAHSTSLRPASALGASYTVTAEQRRREALARLSARAMPLPGQPLGVVPSGRRRGIRPVTPVEIASRPELERPALTEREVEVLRTWLMVDSKPACGEALHISLGTVNTHLTRIRAKYAEVNRPASTKAALVARAIQDDIIDIEEL